VVEVSREGEGIVVIASQLLLPFIVFNARRPKCRVCVIIFPFNKFDLNLI
jgi:hypothetical protein